MQGDAGGGPGPPGPGLGVGGECDAHSLHPVEGRRPLAGQVRHHASGHSADDRLGERPSQAPHQPTHLLLADVHGDAPAQRPEVDPASSRPFELLLVGFTYAREHLDQGLEVVLLVGDAFLGRLLVAGRDGCDGMLQEVQHGSGAGGQHEEPLRRLLRRQLEQVLPEAVGADLEGE